jgi:molecular chaperone GrpE
MKNNFDEPQEALDQAKTKDSQEALPEDKNKKEKTIEPKVLKETEYQKFRREAQDYKDKYIRLLAEFENMRKRSERERIEFVKYANEELLASFLGVLDDLERSVVAAKTKHQDYDAFLKGIELVMARVYELLRKHQVRPIEAVGKKFDPHFHEPLMQEETDEAAEGMVMEEFQKGYMLGERVIRTSKVKVAKSKTKTEIK